MASAILHGMVECGALTAGDDGWQVEPLAWQGSADLCTLANADCLAYFPPGDREYQVGEEVDTYVLD